MDDDLISNTSEIQKYAVMFDKCQTIVFEIIERDVWPRFRRSREYYDHLNSVKATASIIAIVAGMKKPAILSKKVVRVGTLQDSSCV